MKTDESREVVEGFLTSKSERKRVSAGRTLLELGESASLMAIGDAIEDVDDADDLERIGYQLMTAQSLAKITQLADSSQDHVKRLAFRALGERAVEEGAGPKVFEKLVDGTKSRDEGIRAASARAIGAYANDRALAELKGSGRR